jgi:hypothetical protein
MVTRAGAEQGAEGAVPGILEGALDLHLGDDVGRVVPQLEAVVLLENLVRLLLGHAVDATPGTCGPRPWSVRS